MATFYLKTNKFKVGSNNYIFWDTYSARALYVDASFFYRKYNKNLL